MGDLDIADLFDSLPAVFVPLHRPSGGTTYMFVWTSDSTKDDWRADGYRWRQGGSKSVKFGAKTLKKKYFRAFKGPNDWTSDFMRL